jgi:2-methylcitrate dehydratase
LRRREVEDLSHSDQGAIERLAAWLAALRAEDFPDRAVERAKLLLLDTLGCGFAALDDDCARAVLATLDALGERPQCTVLGHPRGMSAPSAVLANGTLIRVLDLNDYVVGAHPQSGARGGHPSDNIPVALAAAELAGSPGRDLLAAIVLAYEIYGRGKALMDADSVWDGVSISGVVAPAAAGWLLRLPEDKVAHAIALSAARAATPVAVREGGISAAKNIANALIAQNGMQATLLAQQGVTGPLDLFEAERGLKAVFTRGPAGDIFDAPLPDDSFIMRSAIKFFHALPAARARSRPASRCIVWPAATSIDSKPSAWRSPTCPSCAAGLPIPGASNRDRARPLTTACISSSPLRSTMARSVCANSTTSAGTTRKCGR